MKHLTLKGIALTIILAFISSTAFAQWQIDNTYAFKINVPSNWIKKSYMDGTDKVYDYYSADENAAIQLRVFKADGRVTTELLAQVYEQSNLPAGTNKQSLSNYTSVNGIPGKQGLYTLNYNGTLVNMAAFYTVQNNIGYVLSAMIPSNMIAQKGEEVKRITQSFVITGFEQNSNIAEQKKPTGGLGSYGGNANQANTSSSKMGLPLPNIAGWKWKEGDWGSATYKCYNMLGEVFLNEKYIKWTGSSANIPDYRYNMTQGEGNSEVHIVGQGECGIDATLSWENKGKYVINYNYPLIGNEMSIRVFTPNTGWVNVQCSRVK